MDTQQQKRSKENISTIANLLPYLGETYINIPKLFLKEALEHIMTFVGIANKYIEESAPWKYSKKNDMESIKLIISDLLEVLRTTLAEVWLWAYWDVWLPWWWVTSSFFSLRCAV